MFVIYAHKQNLAFPLLIFAKLTNAEQPYDQILCTEFHPNQTTKLERSCLKTLTPLSRVVHTVLAFMQLTLIR
jgi:hypothetical protein